MRYQVVDPASGEKSWVEFTGPELVIEGGGIEVRILEGTDGALHVYSRPIEVPHGKFSTISPAELRSLIEARCKESEEDFTEGDTLSLDYLLLSRFSDNRTKRL